MAPKEPTRAQLSSRLAYSQHTPAFLRRLQNKIAGRGGYDDDDDEEEEYRGEHRDEEGDADFEDYDRGSGRPPIPRRPAIPERPAEDPGSADEDDADEKPQVVVLKEGKHLSEREAQNVRRQAKGLPPLPEPEKPSEDKTPSETKGDSSVTKSSKKPTLSFSTSKTSTKPSAGKRKLEAAIGDEEHVHSAPQTNTKKSNPPPFAKKKQKKNKTLLSFGDDA